MFSHLHVMPPPMKLTILLERNYGVTLLPKNDRLTCLVVTCYKHFAKYSRIQRNMHIHLLMSRCPTQYFLYSSPHG